MHDNNYNNNKTLIKKMLTTIEQHKMIKNGDKIVVGVSGGADSVALLRALDAVKTAYNLTLIVCHVNHKIRPGAAERDQKFVEDLCAELGVECHVKEANVEALAKEWDMSDEEAGRRVRYDFFNEIAGSNGKIATAHNKNDNAETVMMRFMRGTGLHGLTGIPYRRGNIIRPILDIARDEIEAYLAEINQTHITDETNLEPIYTRNKVRLNLIPYIQNEFNPNFIDTLANNIANYRDEDDFMTQQANRVVKENFDISDGKIWFAKDILKKEHVAVVKRAIRSAFVVAFDTELSSQSVNNIVVLLNKRSGTRMTIVDDIVASVQYSGVAIQNGSPDKIMCEFKIGTDLVERSGFLNTNNMTIGYRLRNADGVVNNANEFYCPIHMCKNGFTLRTRRDGDVVFVAPGIRKKLKKFFIDNKIDAARRDEYWLLVNENNEVVWIPGLFGSRLKDEDRSGEFVKFEIV